MSMATRGSARTSFLSWSMLMALAAGVARPALADCTATGPWKGWLDAQVDKLITNSDRATAKIVHTAVEECKKKAENKPNIAACTARLEYVSSVLGRDGFGLDQPNATYFEAHKAKIALPSKLSGVKPLFTALEAARLDNLPSVAKAVGEIHKIYPKAIVVPYVSMNTPSFDADDPVDSYGRIVAWIEEGGISHYVQFTVNAQTSNTQKRVQTSVVNYKAGEGAYIVDYQRNLKNDTFELAPRGNDVFCYQCHSSGVLAIHPLEKGTSAEVFAVPRFGISDEKLEELNKAYEPAVAAINAQILKEYDANKGTVGAPANKTHDNQALPNPLITPTGSLCSQEEKAAIQNLAPRHVTVTAKKLEGAAWWTDWASYLASYTKLHSYTPKVDEKTEVYKCTHCHEARGSSIFNKANYQAVVTKYVAGGFMPPDINEYKKDSSIVPNNKDEQARQRANNCFAETYFGANGTLAAWLKAACATH